TSPARRAAPGAACSLPREPRCPTHPLFLPCSILRCLAIGKRFGNPALAFLPPRPVYAAFRPGSIFVPDCPPRRRSLLSPFLRLGPWARLTGPSDRSCVSAASSAPH